MLAYGEAEHFYYDYIHPNYCQIDQVTSFAVLQVADMAAPDPVEVVAHLVAFHRPPSDEGEAVPREVALHRVPVVGLHNGMGVEVACVPLVEQDHDLRMVAVDDIAVVAVVAGEEAYQDVVEVMDRMEAGYLVQLLSTA